MVSSLSLVFAASAWLPFVTASLVDADSHIANLDTRQAANCTSLTSVASTACWDELNIPGYLAEWDRTVPNCQLTGGDGTGCCHPQEPWTICFLRLAYGNPDSDCTTLNLQQCSLNQISPGLDPSIASKAAYVVRNIVVINNLFGSYNEALQSSNISGSDSESTLLSNVLGKDQIGAVLNNGNALNAVLAGLPFWGISSVLASGPQQINTNINPAVAQAFIQSVQNTEALSSIMFGTPYNMKDYVTTDIELANSTADAGNLLQSALNLIMSDVPTFTSWAAHGLYSGPVSFNVPLPAAGLTSAFTTYLVGEALSQARFSATPTTKTFFKEDFQNDRRCTTLGDVCEDSKHKSYYWSPVTQMQYEINEPSDWTRNLGKIPAIELVGYEASAYGLLDYIETSNVFMPVLFDGAYNCTLEGKAGGSAVNINANGSLDIACLSSLPIYLSKDSSCPSGAVPVGGKCPFGFNG